MTREEVNAEIATLARSQGFYGRLQHDLQLADDETRDEFYAQFEDCNDLLDFIMVLES